MPISAQLSIQNKRSVAPYAVSSDIGRENYLGIKKWKQSTLIHANRYTSPAFRLNFSRSYQQSEHNASVISSFEIDCKNTFFF